MRKIEVKDLVIIALLIGLNIVLSRFVSINAWNIKVGFTFVTIYAASYFYGWIGGVTVGALGDLIGALLFPIGPYFPGFSFSAALTGLIYHFVLGKKDRDSYIVASAFLNEMVIGLFLNTYWIHVLYEADYKVLFGTRIFQCIVMMVIQVLSLKLLVKRMPVFERRLKR